MPLPISGARATPCDAVAPQNGLGLGVTAYGVDDAVERARRFGVRGAARITPDVDLSTIEPPGQLGNPLVRGVWYPVTT